MGNNQRLSKKRSSKLSQKTHENTKIGVKISTLQTKIEEYRKIHEYEWQRLKYRIWSSESVDDAFL